jgi:hypothetical protein
VRKVDWGAATGWGTVCRRNAGRRHYNAVRSFRRAWRRAQVARLLLEHAQAGAPPHGLQARIARSLGVSEGTVSRDVRALLEEARSGCPVCGARILPAGVGR